MRVFISWSGSLSRALAVELRGWLPMVVHQVEAWISSRDIDPGKRWALVLGRELAESAFAVICLTRENRQSPWILFEAGAVARSLEAQVVPLLFGITPSDLDGPLAQFQSVQADRPGMEKLVSALYNTSKSGLEARQRDLVFSRLWPILEDRLAALAEQVQRTTEIESPTDLIADLEAPSDRLREVALDKNVMERLEEEQKRLDRELKYLNTEEEKLTQQNAPISLVKWAIEPTQLRLARVESTVKTALDRVVSELSPSQIAILRDLATPRGFRLVRPLEPRLSPKRAADLQALKQLNLVTINEKGAEFSHDFVADYVSKSFGA